MTLTAVSYHNSNSDSDTDIKNLVSIMSDFIPVQCKYMDQRFRDTL